MIIPYHSHSHHRTTTDRVFQILGWIWIAMNGAVITYAIRAGEYGAATRTIVQFLALSIVIPTLLAWAAYKNPWAVRRVIDGILDLGTWIGTTRPVQATLALIERPWLGHVVALVVVVVIFAVMVVPLAVLLFPALLHAAVPRASRWFIGRFWPPLAVLERHVLYIKGELEERDTV